MDVRGGSTADLLPSTPAASHLTNCCRCTVSKTSGKAESPSPASLELPRPPEPPDVNFEPQGLAEQRFPLLLSRRPENDYGSATGASSNSKDTKNKQATAPPQRNTGRPGKIIYCSTQLQSLLAPTGTWHTQTLGIA